MPIFEYRCGKCGELFEELVMSSSQTVACPSCGSIDLEKLISAIAKSSAGCDGCGGGSSCGPT
ncbi:MAG: zinc ribbon domain-containing protein [Candidatus Latescibacterota bacterium]|nr:MAG: zinc ribbon domain-containing protein [Candidatus Latescibacterota bacterium]